MFLIVLYNSSKTATIQISITRTNKYIIGRINSSNGKDERIKAVCHYMDDHHKYNNEEKSNIKEYRNNNDGGIKFKIRKTGEWSHSTKGGGQTDRDIAGF